MDTPDLSRLTPEEKRALLADRLRNRPRRFPASFPQRRLWFLEQLTPGNTAYNLPRAVRVLGDLDVEVWRRAVGTIVQRHEALRTTFADADGEPVQVVRASSEPQIVVVDRPDLRGPGAEAAIRACALEEFARPFDLHEGPLLRLTFLRLAPDDHVLLVTLHHIAADLWSTSIFLGELVQLYGAYVVGGGADLPAPSLQYADYARWQRERVESGELDGDLDHWRTVLEGAPAALELPTDRPRPALAGTRGASVPFSLPEPVMDAVRDLGRRHGVTPFMTLLAAFSVLLHRYSRADDLVLGVPTANRERRELADVIGYFVNMLPVRTDLSGDPTFSELLRRVREASLQAFGHQELPFEVLVEALQPRRDPSRNPVFQVSFIFQNIPIPTFDAGGLRLEPLDVPSTTARFDLELQVFDGPTLEGWFEYSTDLFDAPTVERMARHLRVLVEHLVADPGLTVGSAPMLDDDERAALLAQADGPRRSWPGPVLVHRRVAQHAALSPHRPAVTCGSTTLTYGELDVRVLGLAARLRDLGVGPGVLVGVLVERSVDLVVSMLAVLRAGGAYVPLDPGFPQERLELMLADSGLRVLVTDGAVPELLDRFAGDLVRPGHGAADAADEGAAPGVVVPDESGPDDLAYVIYTSGSTGRPKGVQVEHRALGNFLHSMQETPGMASDDTLVAVTTASFDISMLELFLPLVVGGHVVVAPRDVAVDAHRLADLVDDAAATVVQATPTTWRMLLDGGWRGRPGLRAYVGGEALPAVLAADLRAAGIPAWNLYGPTETTIWSAVGPVDDGPVHLGRPIANTSLHVLDPAGGLVPVGVPGELHIGGDGLARGYLDRPELTAERFVPDPWGPVGARLYRTGDLVRRTTGGRLEFLGRLDHQVKLRGYRIELGEIEEELAGLTGAKEVVASVREDAPGDQRLVAYLVGPTQHRGPDGELAVAALRDGLRRRLPDYMVPTAFVVLDELPHTPNAKVDRARLPAPTGTAARGASYVAPRTAVETVVAATWAEVLGVERVGVHDDFFDLGGHSLLSTRVLVRLREAFGVDVPLHRIFAEPTVSGLSRALLERADSPHAVERTAELLLELSELADDEVDEALSSYESVDGIPT